MKLLDILAPVFLAALAILCVPGAAAQAQESPLYRVNAGDTLRVSVWQEPELQGEVIVGPDGFFSFPLVGAVRAADRTLPEIEVAMRSGLQQYIQEVVLTVSLANLDGYKIYVIGQVQNPGEFVLNRPVDVMSALAMARGLNEFADARGIRILRRTDNGQRALSFDYRQVLRGVDLAGNIMLEAGDVIVVP
jgi:polysaccharide biosynthesis/export protein